MSHSTSMAAPPACLGSFARLLVQTAKRWFRWGQYLEGFAFSVLAQKGIETDLSDETLMTAYLSGDSDALRVLFDRYAPKLMRTALNKGLSKAEAQDAVQQTFIHFHQSREDFQPGAKVRPWLFTIGFNVIRDMGRRYKSRERLKDLIQREQLTQDSPPSASLLPKARIQAALDSLSNEQREVIVLHYYAEMSFAEIARARGWKEGAVRARAHRGYEKLRSLLKTDNPNGVSR